MATSSSTSKTTIQYGTPVAAQDRQLRGAADLAALYGNVDYDRDAIEGIFQKAVDAEYVAKQKAYDRTASQYYNRLGQSQNAYLDAMRKANASAVQNGAAAGMQNANALSTLLGMSQQSSADNTLLTQQGRQLSDEAAAAKTAATKEALTAANANKLALGTLGANVYGVDAQKYVGELGANAQVGAANTAASAQGYAADQNLAGSRYVADQNLKGAQAQAAAAVRAAQATAGGYASQAQIAAAASNYAAQMGLAGQVIATTGDVDKTQVQTFGNILQQGMATGKLDTKSFLNTILNKTTTPTSTVRPSGVRTME